MTDSYRRCCFDSIRKPDNHEAIIAAKVESKQLFQNSSLERQFANRSKFLSTMTKKWQPIRAYHAPKIPVVDRSVSILWADK